MCVKTKCLEARCNVTVPHSLFEALLTDTDEYIYLTKYRNWCVKQYTETNALLKWCPAIDCGKLIQLSTAFNEDNVTCECGNSFCLDCKCEAHEPGTCDM